MEVDKCPHIGKQFQNLNSENPANMVKMPKRLKAFLKCITRNNIITSTPITILIKECWDLLHPP